MAAAMAETIQTDIDMMTRRLELEKRRLHRLEKELAAAQRTYQAKSGVLAKSGGMATSRPSTAPRPWGAPADRGPERPSSRGPRARSATGRAADSEVDGGASCVPSALDATAPYNTLLHRLDVQVKKLNVVGHDNSKLQEEVDQVRRQRLQLNTIFERLKLEIRQRSSQLMDVNEETAVGRTVQGDARQRVAVMTRQRETERQQFKDQVMRIRRDLQDYDFEKKEVEVKLKRAQEGVQKKKGLIMPAEENEFSEPAMMRRIMKTAFLNCIQRRHIKQHEKTIAIFEQAFATIKQSTGISNIEEIVKIFVHLESKNYSLLTYVNHMNKEIEALEGLRVRRQSAQRARLQQEERQEQIRGEVLGGARRQLQAKQHAILASREACAQQRELLAQLRPHLQQLCARIQEELERLRKAAGPLSGDELQRLPVELRDEGIPECLEWVEKALGRFRDLMPSSDKDHVFPITAAAGVKQMPPKRLNAPLQPLVRTQELPSALSLAADDVPASKRSTISAAQKAEILDEEAEEEEFADRPLSLKEIRQRAEQAAARRRKRARPFGETVPNSLSGTGDDRRGGDDRGGGRRRWGSSAEEDHRASPRNNLPDEDEDNVENARRGLGGSCSGDEDEQCSESGTQDSPRSNADRTDSRRNRRDSLGNTKKAARNRRGNHLASQMEDREGSKPAEISEQELDIAFLKRYKMSREELQLMAERMGIHLSNLCFLKQEFDNYDEDRSGYIDAGELKGLLRKLGEDLSDEELEVAFKDLDSDGSGEIEFFEFVEWFTSGDG